MNNVGKYRTGPIVIISSLLQDQTLIKEAVRKLGLHNKVIVFTNGKEALNHLREAEEFPFLIFSEIELPVMSGKELKKAIEEDPILGLLCIPYIFITEKPSQYNIREVFFLKSQGCFDKPSSANDAEALLQITTNYWTKSELPVL
jgi:CheY-like chemotaxis protein